MNYSKLILVGLISAFVAVLTSVLGVAGTVIGSVISSVLYNMLSEALEKPVSDVKIKHDFEWDVAYVFPLIVISLIQLLLICSFLAEFGILPSTFLNAYLSLQDFANNNLYRILGLALIVISVYPLVLKPENVKKVHGVIIAAIGIVFLARGFVDMGNQITDLYHPIFAVFDFPIAVIAFILLVFVIVRILMSARESDNNSKKYADSINDGSFEEKYSKYFENDVEPTHRRVVHVRKNPQTESTTFKRKISPKVDEYVHKRTAHKSRIKDFEEKLVENKGHSFKPKVNKVSNNENATQTESGINKSSKNIQFESNDLLDEYKK
ncbi:hypothetical protein [uncultured Methanobrevibacter sp.]|uniref:hypothetical protein n=1 Tax=uncultured Methanobrevibacter sp. TaxID=253161 RepID=UPI0025D40B6A|nr:hypothetical protein [uncultured Methanobrevibacter sp.]